MNALSGDPANTTSRGSSPTTSVRVTCGVPARLTTLTLSESRLVTHTSVLLRAATATGSSPTRTRPVHTGAPEVKSKISSVPLGALAANSVFPSGDIASGRTGPLSNSTNAGPVDAARAACLPKNSRPPIASNASVAAPTTHRVIGTILPLPTRAVALGHPLRPTSRRSDGWTRSLTLRLSPDTLPRDPYDIVITPLQHRNNILLLYPWGYAL